MKICMIVNNPFTNDSRVLKESQSLSRAGYSVVVFATKSKNLPYEETKGSVKIKRPVSGYFFSLRFWNYLIAFYKSVKILQLEKADIYHSHDLDTLLVSYLAAKKNNARLVYDFHEFWPNKTTFYKKGFLGILHVFVKPILLLTEKVLVRKANCFITVNESLSRLFAEYYKTKKPLVLYNAPYKRDRKFDMDKNLKKLIKDYSFKSEDKLILYLGLLIDFRGVDKLIDASLYLPNNYKVVFMGYGDLKNYIIQIAGEEKFKYRIFFIEAVNPSSVVSYASSADLGVAPIQNASLSYYYSTPNKIFEYLMAGLPIAVSDFPEMKRIVKEKNVGITFDQASPKDIAEKIKEVLSNESRYNEMKKNCLKAARKNYNWGIEEKKLLKLYRNL